MNEFEPNVNKDKYTNHSNYNVQHDRFHVDVFNHVFHNHNGYSGQGEDDQHFFPKGTTNCYYSDQVGDKSTDNRRKEYK